MLKWGQIVVYSLLFSEPSIYSIVLRLIIKAECNLTQYHNTVWCCLYLISDLCEMKVAIVCYVDYYLVCGGVVVLLYVYVT